MRPSAHAHKRNHPKHAKQERPYRQGRTFLHLTAPAAFIAPEKLDFWRNALLRLQTSARLTRFIRRTFTARTATAIITARQPIAIRTAHADHTLIRETFISGLAGATRAAATVIAAISPGTVRHTDTCVFIADFVFSRTFTAGTAALVIAALSAVTFRITLADPGIGIAMVIPRAFTADTAALIRSAVAPLALRHALADPSQAACIPLRTRTARAAAAIVATFFPVAIRHTDTFAVRTDILAPRT